MKQAIDETMSLLSDDLKTFVNTYFWGAYKDCGLSDIARSENCTKKRAEQTRNRIIEAYVKCQGILF